MAGRASAKLFVSESAGVIAVDRNATAISSMARCDTRVLDLTDAVAIAAPGASIGAVDALFNCAGYVDAGTVLDHTDAGY